MGLPLAVLAYGQAGFSAMVALFTVSNLLHFTLGVWIIDHHARFGRLLANPMVVATVLGFAFAAFHPPLPEWLATALKLTGDAMIPLMLISLGVRLSDVPWSSWRVGVIGGLVRPLAGIVVAGALILALSLDREQQGLLLIFGCLPPAVLNFMAPTTSANTATAAKKSSAALSGRRARKRRRRMPTAPARSRPA